jgi:hypothetical protein
MAQDEQNEELIVGAIDGEDDVINADFKVCKIRNVCKIGDVSKIGSVCRFGIAVVDVGNLEIRLIAI